MKLILHGITNCFISEVFSSCKTWNNNCELRAHILKYLRILKVANFFKCCSYLPEEMRNPDSFKWMLQNPMYRQQLQDMLNNMGGSPDQWDNRMLDHLKNFDLSSPEVRQQFAQVGMTPEEVVSKIMANPEVAVAFQNPKIQTAIMDCSQNPLNIVKYQNDKEVMDVFMKISQIFPQING
jgi:hypothetical protein